jgi:hypothetical protein
MLHPGRNKAASVRFLLWRASGSLRRRVFMDTRVKMIVAAIITVAIVIFALWALRLPPSNATPSPIAGEASQLDLRNSAN